MLRYSDDGRYIIQYSPKTWNYIELGPYKKDMLPEIKNADGTARVPGAIPEPNKSAYDLYPNLRSEFIRFTDNKYSNLTLKDVKPGCGYKTEFKCKTCNHKWIAYISNRIYQKQGCPHCCKIKISFPEKYIYYCLKQVDSNLQENYRISNSQLLEFDMYDPILKLAIEFNGAYHNKNSADDKKQQLAISNNINLIRVWQYNNGKRLELTDKNNYIIPASNSINNVPYLDIIINDICMQYGADYQKIDRQLASNQAFIRTNKTPPAGESLLDLCPDICRDWDYSKNGAIKPEMLKPGSGIKVWWKCLYCGREWEAPISQRTAANKSLRAGCKYCNNKIGQGLMQEIPYIPAK